MKIYNHAASPKIMYVTGFDHTLDMFYIDRYDKNKKTHRVFFDTEKQMLRVFQKIKRMLNK